MQSVDKEFEDIDLSQPRLYWYVLRVLRDEQRSIAHIKEFIQSRGLQNRIVDIKSFKEFEVVESEDYPPNSDDFPKRGLKSTAKSVWVKLSNGNYKRLRIVQKNPFGGMIFIKMEHNLDLFKAVRSWDASFSFLNYPNPQIMPEQDLKNLEVKFNGVPPNLEEYAANKNYKIVEGLISDLKGIVVEKSEEELKREAQEAKEVEKRLQEEKLKREEREKVKVEQEKQKQEEESYTELNIEFDQMPMYVNPQPKSGSKKSSGKFMVNDMVMIKKLGFSGIIQEINYENDKVVVGVNMFGRKQPIECKISEIANV